MTFSVYLNKCSANRSEAMEKKLTIEESTLFLLSTVVKLRVKSQTSEVKLDPDEGSVKGWPTTYQPTRQLFLSLKLLIKVR